MRRRKVGPRALEKPHIGAVIDDAGEIGVLVVDADGKNMTAVFQAARKIRPFRH